MKTIKSLLFFIGISLGVLFAQEPEVHFGPEIGRTKINGVAAKQLPGGFLKDAYLTYSIEGKINKSLTLFKYDAKLKLISQRTHVLKHANQLLRFQKVWVHDSQIKILTSYENGSEKKKVLVLFRIEPENLTQVGQVEEVLSLTLPRRIEIANFHFATNNKESVLILFTNLKRFDRDDRLISLTAFDPEMNIIWQREEAFTKNAKAKMIKAVKVEPDGSCILQITQIIQNGTLMSINKGDQYNFWLYDAKGNPISSHEYINQDDNRVSAVLPLITPQGNLLCVGVYIDQEKIVRGIAKLTFDSEDSKLQSKKLIPFKGNEEAKNWPENLELNLMGTEQIIQRPDGGFVLVNSLSFNYIDQRSSELKSVFADLLVSSISPDAEFEWTNRIYIPPQTTDYLYVRDNPNYLTLRPKGIYFFHQKRFEDSEEAKSGIFLSVLKPNGEIRSKDILNPAFSGASYCPSVLMARKRNRFLGAVEKEGKLYLVALKL